ncbi:MAG: RNA methyltransferase [Candidatus Nezhaarchaeota archaeon]|nr:RNA methyltransferase [Candidatus Nezhaarchaeota archaeon]MCX8141867.1 RNA methyltransferase [Candidatus Nezhaarchaeota archaeon]MDW8050352.1 RNA methyltransferase [Nitrososphaerota archaeon]
MPHIRVVLVEPLYEINIGLTCRVMKNLGFKDLCIVRPRTAISSVARMFAVKAVDILNSMLIVDSIEEAIRGFDIKVGTTGELAGPRNIIRTVVPPWHLQAILKYDGKVALLFGREDIGLTNDELSMCDIVVNIPTSDEYPVMNVTHAIAIILYELSKMHIKPKLKLAGEDLRNVALKYFSEALDTIEFPAEKKEKARIVFKRLLGKSMISKKEMYVLLAFLRKMNQKLRFHDV